MIYLALAMAAQLLLAAAGFHALLRYMNGLTAVHNALVADLLQRIQAPEAAVIQHAVAARPPDPAPLPFDDDEAFHKTREELAAELNLP